MMAMWQMLQLQQQQQLQPQHALSPAEAAQRAAAIHQRDDDEALAAQQAAVADAAMEKAQRNLADQLKGKQKYTNKLLVHFLCVHEQNDDYGIPQWRLAVAGESPSTCSCVGELVHSCIVFQFVTSNAVTTDGFSCGHFDKWVDQCQKKNSKEKYDRYRVYTIGFRFYQEEGKVAEGQSSQWKT